MKVILLQEIKGQGGEGDVVEVKRGYAVNYLFPKKMAIEASKGNLKQLELRKHNIAKREADRLDSADKILNALANKVLVIGARVGEEGQLFGSVTTQQIAERLGEEFGLEIDRRKIDLRAPIKTAGEHSVSVSIYRDVKAVLTIEVVSEATLASKEAPKLVVEAAVEAAEDAAEEAAVDEVVEDASEAVEAEEQAEEDEVVADIVEAEEQAEEAEAEAEVAEAEEQAEDTEAATDLVEEEEQADSGSS